MNFGAFAGGVSTGWERGMKIGKDIREIIKERKQTDFMEKAQAEADAEHSKSVGDLIKKNGVTDQPTSGPVEKAAPAVVATPAAEPTGAVATPVPPQPGNPYDPGDTRTDPKPVVASPTPTVAGQPATPPSVSTQSPAAPATATAPTVASPAATAPAAVAPAQPAPANPIQAAPTAQAAPTTPQSIAAAGTSVTPKSSSPFTVMGQGYDTEEQARAAAKKQVASANEIFIQKSTDFMQRRYIAEGSPEKSKAYLDYSESVAGKRKLTDAAKIFTAPDFDTAIQNAGSFINKHLDGDTKFVGHEMITKADGSQVAMVKVRTNGKDSQIEMTRSSLMDMVSAATDPKKFFEQAQAKEAAAQKFKFEQKVKNDERRQTNADNITRDDRKADRDDQRRTAQDKALDGRVGLAARAKNDENVLSLRDAGFADAEIQRMMPSLLGVGDHKKTTDPTERRALVTGDLMKNDPTFSRASPAEQTKKVDALIGVIYGGEAKPAAPAAASAAPSANPNAIYRNNETGERFRVIDGKRVPIGAPPTAGGPPAKAGPATGMPRQNGGASGSF